jgi:protease-4
VGSLAEASTLLLYAAHDPRVLSVLIQLDGRLSCWYAKLAELRRMMQYFRSSGKRVTGYCAAGAEKELFVSLGCDEFFIPPDGSLDLRGFAGGATFLRGVFDRVGVEPQVERIGKYKSFGDSFNRTGIAEAQREVVSSLLMEGSDYWLQQVSDARNISVSDLAALCWLEEGVRTPYDWARAGLVTGVRYLDQVEACLLLTHRSTAPPSLLERAVTWVARRRCGRRDSRSRLLRSHWRRT